MMRLVWRVTANAAVTMACLLCTLGAPRGTVVAAAAPTPYSGTAVAVPATIPAANYDTGGESVAYHDTTSGNSGGAYRQDNVDIEASSEGGYDVGWIAAGEWLNYGVTVATAGSYTAQIRVASPGGGTLHIGFNANSNVWKAVTVPATGGWQAWTTVSVPVTLGTGGQLMTLLFDTNGFNVSYVKVVSASGGGTATSGAGPYSGTPSALPGTLPAANFDNGGEGVAYHDTTAGNTGGAYRSTDVDIQASTEGGYDIGWTAAGEWLNYTVNVTSGGSYTAQLRVASPGGGTLHLGFNTASNVWATVAVPATGGWQTWTTVSVPVTLGAGVQQITVLFDTGSTNLASIAVAAGASSPPPPPSAGGTITVPAGGNLQAAIDGAQSGDTILLAPGATYSGSFSLPAKGGTGYVTIRSGAPDSSLPGSGVRVTPQYASSLARIQGGIAGMPAFTTEPGAHHFKLQFLEIVSTYAANDIVELGDGSRLQNSLSLVPHDLVVDRCYIHGDPTNGQKRGIALNSASTSIVNSYISNIKSTVSDSQAIAGWNGPGPYTIENNYLEAAGETFLLGGSDPAIPNLVPSDVSFRFNHVTKQQSWRGQGWVVKNLVEFKNAQRVVIDGNVMEYNWAAAQTGYAIVLTPRNQEGTAPWSVVQHIQITNNIVRHVASAINILGLDTTTTTVTNDITVRNNLFDDISAANWGGRGQLLLTVGGSHVTIDHNTVFTDGSSVVYADGPDVSGFVFTNNIIPDNAYAVMGSNASEGSGTLAMYYPGATFRRNVLVGGNAGVYPSDNYFPSTVADVGFVDASSGNYRLSSSSPYNNLATDGSDIGCNMDALRP
jgi:hypothetical protein